jgi:DNA-binding CsgD family transcriptional regulator
LLLTEQPASALVLTPRERDVMRCVAAGLSNAEIAGVLWIQLGTVRKHLEHVYDKLGVRTRTAALARLHATAAPLGPSAGGPRPLTQVRTGEPLGIRRFLRGTSHWSWSTRNTKAAPR